MKEEDYPALLKSAEDLSGRNQLNFNRAIQWQLYLLITTAVLTILYQGEAEIALIQAILMLGALSCSIYLASIRPDRLWYAGRAVSESIKTLTWRYISKAEPFDERSLKNRNADQLFQIRLKAVVDQNKDITSRFSKFLDGKQITQEMVRVRALSEKERIQFYSEKRIADQKIWYSKKSDINRKKAKIFFVCLIGANALGIIFAIARILYPKAPFWPTDVFVALSGAALTWMQTKRFTDLANSYALAAHEINLLGEQAKHITPDNFSSFVGDAENAFSREHTQWVARQDS
jgi:hypothetical protein